MCKNLFVIALPLSLFEAAARTSASGSLRRLANACTRVVFVNCSPSACWSCGVGINKKSLQGQEAKFKRLDHYYTVKYLWVSNFQGVLTFLWVRYILAGEIVAIDTPKSASTHQGVLLLHLLYVPLFIQGRQLCLACR